MSEQNAQVERLTLAKAITRGLDDAMADNRKVVLIGEDIGKLGGVYRVTEGLLAKHGQKRVMDSPLGEAGIVGTSIGMAMRGYRPVAEIQFDGFVFPRLQPDQPPSSPKSTTAATKNTLFRLRSVFPTAV